MKLFISSLYWVFILHRNAVATVTEDHLRVDPTANSIRVSWTSFPPYPSKYELSCICSLLCDATLITNIVMNVTPKETFALITGLLPGSTCNISLSEHGQHMAREDITKVASANAETAYKVPTGYPTKIQAKAYSPTAAILSWTETECSLRNGPITDHEYILVDMSSGSVSTGTISASAISSDSYGSIPLLPCVQYKVSMAAVNPVGRGPYSPSILLNVNNESDHYQQACVLTGSVTESDSSMLPTGEVKVSKPQMMVSDMMTIVGPALGVVTLATTVVTLLCCVLCLFKRRREMKSKPYAQLLKRRTDESIDCAPEPSASSSSSTTSLMMDEEESDGVDKDNEPTEKSIHTNTPVDAHDPLYCKEVANNVPTQLQDPIFSAAMANLHREAERSI